MSDAKKQSNGKWRNLLYVGKDANGKRIYESFTADTKREANALAAARARELEVHGYKQQRPTEMTVREAAEKYIADRYNVLKPKTIREYKHDMNNYFQHLMDTRLKNLNDEVLQSAINTECGRVSERTHRRLSPKTVRNAWGLISASLSAAMPDRKFHVTLPALAKPKCKIPREEQLLMLLDYVHGKRIELPIILSATCGMRRSEICALDLKKDVDYRDNRIDINKALTIDEFNNWVLVDNKSYESARILDAPAWVIEALAEARDSGYTWMNPDHVSTAFAYICDKLGIDIRLHDLRHYYASLMHAKNVPEKYAMARMGHSSPYMLRKVYQHLMDEKDIEIREAINDHFDNMQLSMQRNKSDTSENAPKKDNIV